MGGLHFMKRYNKILIPIATVLILILSFLIFGKKQIVSYVTGYKYSDEFIWNNIKFVSIEDYFYEINDKYIKFTSHNSNISFAIIKIKLNYKTKEERICLLKNRGMNILESRDLNFKGYSSIYIKYKDKNIDNYIDSIYVIQKDICIQIYSESDMTGKINKVQHMIHFLD